TSPRLAHRRRRPGRRRVTGAAAGPGWRGLRSGPRFELQAVHPAPSTAESTAQAKAGAHLGQDDGRLPSGCDGALTLRMSSTVTRIDVRFWHKADITGLSSNVRFWG